MSFKVGIIGRPNVGKSTLFNRFVGKRIAIVDDMPGVTRDRLEGVCEWEGRSFLVYDTAGFDLREDILKKEMNQQFMMALDEVDLCIVMADAKEGIHPLDEIVVSLLRDRGKNFIIAVNKVDSEEKEMILYDFCRLGTDEMIGISATHGRNVDDLLDKIVSFIPEEEDVESYGEGIKIAVIGRPNVGKSSLINKWLGEERVIVTPIPGTTRDSVDTFFEYNDEKYVLIDTAGIRKKSVMFKDKIEKYGYFRSHDSIERCDVAVALIDAGEGITERDVKIIADAYDAGRPVIIGVNKWDLPDKKEDDMKKIQREIVEHLKFITNPVIFLISAVTGKNIFKIFEAVQGLYNESRRRIQTSDLNKILQTAQQRHQAPVTRNTRVKFYYMTQVNVNPPEFVIFVNYPEAVHFSYARFIHNVLRENFGFDSIPIKIHFRKRKGRDED